VKKLIVAMLTALVASSPALATQSVKAKVNGMVCAFCAQGIEKKLRRVSAWGRQASSTKDQHEAPFLPQKDPFMHAATNTTKPDRRVVPWNKGKLIGQKPR